MKGESENKQISYCNKIVILRSRRHAGRRLQGRKGEDCRMQEEEDEEKGQEGEVKGAEGDCGYLTPISYQAEQPERQKGGRGEVMI